MHVRILAQLTVVAALAWGGERASRVPPSEWTLREELRLGVEPGPADDLAGLRGIAVSPTGTVYAFGVGDLVVFGPDRRATRRPSVSTIPLRGGPGGFGWWRDSLWAYDARGSFIALLNARGDVVRKLPYVGEPWDSPADSEHRSGEPTALRRSRRALLGDTTFLALLADGSVLRTMPLPDASDTLPRATMRIIPGPARVDTSTRVTTLLVRAALTGEVLRGLEMLAGPWSDARVPSPYGHVARVAQPFQDHQLVATTPDGSEVIVVERFAPLRPGLATYAIARFHAVTGRRWSHRFQYDPTPVTETDVEVALSRMLDSARGAVPPQFVHGFPSRVAAASALRSVIRRPAYHSPFTDIVVGADRSVWLLEHATGRWVAHTADGRVAGSIALPARGRPVHADSGVLWTVAPATEPGRGQVLIRHRIIER